MAREHWKSRFGFVLAAVGSAIGLGNLWKFPYITYDNGGGAFVLVYLAAVVLVGLPIMISELVLGRRSQKDPVGAFKVLSPARRRQESRTRMALVLLCLLGLYAFLTLGGRLEVLSDARYLVLFLVGLVLLGAAGWFLISRVTDRGRLLAPLVGWLGVAAAFTILSYYAVIAGWTLHYSILGLAGLFRTLDPESAGSLFGDFVSNPWLQVGYQFVFMAITAVIVWRGVQKGVEATTRLLMPVLFLMVVGLAGYSMARFGASEAIHFLFRPSFSELTPAGILEAVGHAFFTLSLGLGAMLTYGSYMDSETSILKTSIWVSALDTLVALTACFLMYPIILSQGVAAEDFKSIGILFTTVPLALSETAIGGVVTGAFYILVAFAAVTSTISLLEVTVAYGCDELGWRRHVAAPVMALAIWIFGVPSAASNGGCSWISSLHPFTKGGHPLNWLDSFDYLASNWMLPLGGLFIALFTGWVLPERDARDELGPSPAVTTTWLYLVRVFVPVVLVVVFLNGLGLLGMGD